MVAMALALPTLLVACGPSASDAEKIEDELNALTEKLGEEVEESTGGYEVNDEAGNFKATFPAKPEMNSETVPTEIGDIEMVMYYYEAPGGKTAYMIAYSDYPEALIKEADPYELLHAGKEGGFGEFKAKIKEEKEYKYKDKYPALRATGDNGEIFVYAKYLMVGNRFYQILKAKEDAYADPDKTDAFFTSFDILVD